MFKLNFKISKVDLPSAEKKPKPVVSAIGALYGNLFFHMIRFVWGLVTVFSSWQTGHPFSMDHLIALASVTLPFLLCWWITNAFAQRKNWARVFFLAMSWTCLAFFIVMLLVLLVSLQNLRPLAEFVTHNMNAVLITGILLGWWIAFPKYSDMFLVGFLLRSISKKETRDWFLPPEIQEQQA